MRFDYVLPPELLAQYPVERRDESRLLGVDPVAGTIENLGLFRDIAAHLKPGDLLVLNDTRVFRARLAGKRQSGGKVEALLLETGSGRVRALLRPLTRLKDGETFDFGGFPGTLAVRHSDGTVTLDLKGKSALEVAAAVGEVPIPPYLKRGAETIDTDRYQTVYAEKPGAAAAPTAGLHFTPELLESIRSAGVRTASLTLEVGYGTFAPVHPDQTRLHGERYTIPDATLAAMEETRGKGRVIAVGTTVARALETHAAGGEKSGITELFIRPGFAFRAVDALITNFHLPGSSLLLLVHAFAGDIISAAYDHAVKEKYRFYSYGDAMFVSNRL